VKIITGIRRCGKSFLLSTLYRQFLIDEGINEGNIITIDLEKKGQAKYRNPLLLFDYIVARTSNQSERYYIFIDEIQLSAKAKDPDIDESTVADDDIELMYVTFYDVLNDLRDRRNLDIYVTGSNSKMLSKDIVTNFRDRGSEIQVYPLSFAEYYSYSGLEKPDALEQYKKYGGMPLSVTEPDEKEKRKYLRELHKRVYYKDIVERYGLKDDSVLDALVDSLYSSVGSLTNIHNISNAAATLMNRSTSDHTVKAHIDHLEDAYLIQHAQRYDVKGKRYFDYPMKYYAMDVGLRNAKLNFRQQDEGHILENIIYNELIRRGYFVDVGMVQVTRTVDGKRVESQHEIDFIVNTGSGKVYIQSAMQIDDEDKKRQETMSLRNTMDSFRKIVVLGGNQMLWTDEEGISYVGVIPFLLDENSLNL